MRPMCCPSVTHAIMESARKLSETCEGLLFRTVVFAQQPSVCATMHTPRPTRKRVQEARPATDAAVAASFIPQTTAMLSRVHRASASPASRAAMMTLLGACGGVRRRARRACRSNGPSDARFGVPDAGRHDVAGIGPSKGSPRGKSIVRAFRGTSGMVAG